MVINNQSDCKIAKFLKHIKISRIIFKNPPPEIQKQHESNHKKCIEPKNSPRREPYAKIYNNVRGTEAPKKRENRGSMVLNMTCLNSQRIN